MNTATFLGDKAINRMGLGGIQLAGPPPVHERPFLRHAIACGLQRAMGESPQPDNPLFVMST